MASPFAITDSTRTFLIKVHANGDDDDDEGDDDNGGRGGDDDDGDGEDRNSRSFRFDDNDRDLRQLLDLLLQDRDNDVKQELEAKPKTYKGFGLKDSDDNSNKDFNFAAVGDFGCSKNAENTVKNMEDKKPELVLPLGDLSYQSTANCWFDMMTPLKGKIMVTLGHHDVNDGGEKLDQYVKGFDFNKHYYSYDYNNVHFLIMASESKFKNGSEQYDFVKQDLEKTSTNKDINWIVVTIYRPLYTSPSKHTAEESMRDLYHPLFDKYGIDLVLQAHNHNYQRTYPLTYNPEKGSNPIMTNGFTTGYNSFEDGVVFATVGTGGEGFYTLDGRSPFIATQFDRFGFLNLEIKNGNPHTTLTGTFFDNKGDEIKDYFTIKKEIK